MQDSIAPGTANSMIGPSSSFPPNSLCLAACLLMAILAAGAGGGLAASIATCPLDVVKTKLQAQRATLDQADYLGISGLSNLVNASSSGIEIPGCFFSRCLCSV